jgi:hypothetical protein
VFVRADGYVGLCLEREADSKTHLPTTTTKSIESFLKTHVCHIAANSSSGTTFVPFFSSPPIHTKTHESCFKRNGVLYPSNFKHAKLQFANFFPLPAETITENEN